MRFALRRQPSVTGSLCLCAIALLCASYAQHRSPSAREVQNRRKAATGADATGLLVRASPPHKPVSSEAPSALLAATLSEECADGFDRSCTVLVGEAVARAQTGHMAAATRDLLDQACDLGDGDACSALGRANEFALPRVVDAFVGPMVATGHRYSAHGFVTTNRSLYVTDSLCHADRAASNCYFAGEHLNNLQVAKDKGVASLSHYAIGCDAGDPAACIAVAIGRDGAALAQRNADSLHSVGLQLWAVSCERRLEPSACFNFATALMNGHGGRTDTVRALPILDEACRDDQMGIACARARSLRARTPLAKGAHERALPRRATPLAIRHARDCDGGGTPSCVVLAQFLASGHGVSKSVRRAAQLFADGCQRGQIVSCDELLRLPTRFATSDVRSAALSSLCYDGHTPSCNAAAEWVATAGKRGPPSYTALTMGTLRSQALPRALLATPDAQRQAGAIRSLIAFGCTHDNAASCASLLAMGSVLHRGAVTGGSLLAAESLYTAVCAAARGAGCDSVTMLGKELETSGVSDALDLAVIGWRTACRARLQAGCAELLRITTVDESGRNIPRAIGSLEVLCLSYPFQPGTCSRLARLLVVGAPVKSPAWQRARAALHQDCVLAVPGACQAQRDLEWADADTFPVNRPIVNSRTGDYTNIRFVPNDVVEVDGGGCVQTGGAGKTWKRYVDPDPSNNYFGMVTLPTLGEHRISDLRGRKDQQIKGVLGGDLSDYYLRVGYQDHDGSGDHHGDNGYYKHDDGTNNQCRNSVDAFITIVVHHVTIPLDRTEQLKALKPMDLWWDVADPSLLPYNPDWVAHILNPSQRPDALNLCNSFKLENHALELGNNCVTFMPTVDEGPSGGFFDDLWNAATLDFNDIIMSFVCGQDLFDQHEVLASSSVRGHINWGPATFTGAVYFEDFQVPPGSWHRPFGSGDGDYDLALIRDDEAGVLRNNQFTDFGSGRRGLTLEFDSREVGDLMYHGWWDRFHYAVDHHPVFGGDWSGAGSMINGRAAKVIGLLGIDTKHWVHSELHPVFAMAIQVGGDATRERWAFFARNVGNEGGCGHSQHRLLVPGDKVSFFFPYPLIVDDASSDVRATFGPIIAPAGQYWGVRPAKDGSGTLLTVTMPGSLARSVVYGEVEFCRTACGPRMLASAVQPVRRPPDGPRVARHEASDDESAFEALTDHLSLVLQQRFRDTVSKGTPARAFHGPARAELSVLRDDASAPDTMTRLTAADERKQLVSPSRVDETLRRERATQDRWFIHVLANGDTARAIDSLRKWRRPKP